MPTSTAPRRTSIPANQTLIDWLRSTLADFAFDIEAIYRRDGDHDWPLTAKDPADLARQLKEGGHFLSLPKEPAALANVLEVSVVDFLLERVKSEKSMKAVRGTERGYPDIEISGRKFGGGFHALDIKVARRGKTGRSTQSAITLYTGNTYFRYPQLRWPGTFRPFQDYASHLDLIGIYTLNEKSKARVEDLELIVQEPWRIASRQRSSSTREYIGAIKKIKSLREGKGEFETEADFYAYWRKYDFRIGRAVQRQLDKLLAEQHKS